jgi:hypothetical protein
MPFTPIWVSCAKINQIRFRVAIAFVGCFYYVDSILDSRRKPLRSLKIDAALVIGTAVTEALSQDENRFGRRLVSRRFRSFSASVAIRCSGLLRNMKKRSRGGGPG